MRISDWSSDVCSSDLRVVDAVHPHREQRARHAAGVKIALLPEATDLADARARRHRHHRRVRRVVHARQRQLPFGRRRAAQRADLAVRPRLLRDPAQRVVAVGLRIAEDLVVALAEVAAALVLRSEEHTSELKSLMRISYDVFCFKKKKYKLLNTEFC